MAGVSTKEIKTRIRSMESTKQITKAMEMVAASKLRKTQTQALTARPYYETLRNAIDDILSANQDFSSGYLQQPAAGKKVYIVIAGDRGLAGGYNSNILKMVATRLEENAVVLPIGKKAVEFFKSRQIPLLTENYCEAADVSLGDCFSIAKKLCKRYHEGEFSKIEIAYTQFVSVLSQVPKTVTMLPLEQKEVCDVGGNDIIYEPDSKTVFDAIIPEYLGGVLYGVLCESRASEQAARRTAMDSATQNAEEMIGQLSLQFNRARQAAITSEIIDIVAGSQ